MADEDPNSLVASQPLKERSVDRQSGRQNLSGQQYALYRALLEKDKGLADIYLGAMTVLGQTGNPDELALAAHGLRELIEKIPALVDVKIKAQREGLKAKVREIEGHWEKTVEESECIQNTRWVGEIDRHLSNLLERLKNFFQWFAEHHPRRKAEIVSTLKGLDISGRALPLPLEELNVQAWDKIRDYFVTVAHHRKQNPAHEEFDQWLDALERFLLDRLRPRTFADIDTIDEIIAEGESDA